MVWVRNGPVSLHISLRLLNFFFVLASVPYLHWVRLFACLLSIGSIQRMSSPGMILTEFISSARQMSHRHVPSDIFVHDAVKSREEEGPAEHLHLHNLEGLLVFGGGCPTLFSSISFIDLAIGWNGHSAVTENACYLSGRESPLLWMSEPRYLTLFSCCPLTLIVLSVWGPHSIYSVFLMMRRNQCTSKCSFQSCTWRSSPRWAALAWKDAVSE